VCYSVRTPQAPHRAPLVTGCDGDVRCTRPIRPPLLRGMWASAIYCSTLYLINGHSGGATHAKTMLSAVSVSRQAAWSCTNTPLVCMLVK